MRFPKNLLCLAAAASLTACGANATPSIPARGAAAATNEADGTIRAKARLQILVPRRRTRHSKYVSPATQSIAITVAGRGKSLQFNRGLTTADPACQATAAGTQCTLMLALPPGTYAGTFVTYDGPLVNGAPSGAVLSSDRNVPIAIAASAANTIGVTLYGVPASVTIVPATGSTMTGSVSAGFTLSKCASSQPVDVLGVDASGNYIIGPGAPSIGLESSDTSHLAVTPPAAQAQNTFALSLPSIPDAKSVVHLSLSATPSTASGASTAKSQTTVTFNGDVCGKLTEFPLGHSVPLSIVTGPDGAMWFTEPFGNKIGRITTAGVLTNEYSVPTASSLPFGIAAGSDGALWFTEASSSKIGRITTSGSVTEIPTTTAAAQPGSIISGPDQNLWLTEGSANKIARVSTGGTVAEFPITSANSEPAGITTGPDGNIWFTEDMGGKLGSMTLQGVAQPEIPIPGGHSPSAIVTGPGSKLWFVDCVAGLVEVYLPSTAPLVPATFGTYALPAAGAQPRSVVLGPDGALWIVDGVTSAIVRVTPGPPLSITEYPLPNSASGPSGIAVGPDGAIWFSESVVSQVGRLQ
jgi:virginiamycin B lyase